MTANDHQPHIDGLRAIAILLVLGYHAWPEFVAGGFIGVDVFFVISGFLITRQVAEQIGASNFSLTGFFVRRARRLLPAAVVCFALVTLAGAALLLPDVYKEFGRSLMASVLMYANVHFYQVAGYFAAPMMETPLLHTWSLAVEDQFYLTWPLLLMLGLRPLGHRNVLILLVLLSAASLALAEVSVWRDRDAAFYLLPSRAWELLGGAGLAIWLTSPSAAAASGRFAMAVWLRSWIGLAGIVAIIALAFVPGLDERIPGLVAVPIVLATLAIIACGLNGHGAAASVLSVPPLVGVGLISYSLYLYHWPMLSLASYRLERPLEALEALPVVAAAFPLAWLSWRYIEQPFRRRHPVSQRRRDAGFAAAAVLVVVALFGAGAFIRISRGVPERFSGEVLKIMGALAETNPLRVACDGYENVFRHDETCNFGRQKSADEGYQVVLIGDSMADHWAPLVADFAKTAKLSGRQVTNGGCAPLISGRVPMPEARKEAECAAYASELERFIVGNPSLKLIVVSAYWSKWLGYLDGGDRGSAGAFEKSLRTSIEKMRSRGARIHFIGQMPGFSRLPLRCLISVVERGGNFDACGQNSRELLAVTQPIDAILRKVAGDSSGLSISLPRDFMCQAAMCSPMMDGKLIYRDGGHVSRSGALYLARYIRFPAID